MVGKVEGGEFKLESIKSYGVEGFFDVEEGCQSKSFVVKGLIDRLCVVSQLVCSGPFSPEACLLCRVSRRGRFCF